MTKPGNTNGPEARLAKGFRDIEAAELRAISAMIDKIRAVYERYGFEPLETPAIEYADALGKFLPDQDRPNEGVFSLQDDDEQWMSLRYDLTAPLARYVAQNFATLPKPFRRYAFGNVYRNEKPGPGRFRQFMQFDADTVGAESLAADAEMCMLAADALEALGIRRGDYVIKVNSRKVLDGVMEAIGVTDERQKLTVLRAIDKYDRLGWDGVAALLGKGRKDESGDFTNGANLSYEAIQRVKDFLFVTEEPGIQHYQAIGQSDEYVPDDELLASTNSTWFFSSQNTIAGLGAVVGGTAIGEKALSDLSALFKLTRAANYGSKRIRFDPSVVRGLDYYTGPVFEAELTFEVKGDNGEPVRFGSVGGGGRYDDLVARFTGEKVPATGFSIGVSRLQAALSALGRQAATPTLGPVVVLVMDKAELSQYQRLTQTLRNAGIRAEMYLGSSGMKAQMKYADKRGSPLAVIQGSDERAKGEVTLKDLIEGAKAAATIKDNKEWKELRPAQIAVKECDLVAEVRKILARHSP
jgi:histidyl-tRNA synthetase